MSFAQAIIRSFTAAGRIPKGDLGSVIRISMTACCLPLLTRTMALPSLLAFLDSPAKSEMRDDPTHLLGLVGGVLARDLGPFKPGCYRRSLILFRELRRHGRPARVVFGIRDQEDSLDGHAWVEVDGKALGEPEDPSKVFRVVYSYPDPSPTEEIQQ